MTQAYPLQWPQGRPRTAKRRPSAFKVTPRKAYDELCEELDRFGAKPYVISSNAPLRQRDGTPYADALSDKFEDPGVAVYFTRKKRPVCIVCDTYPTVYENIRALGLSVEAMRDMDRWGAGQVLDQAFEGFAALPPPGAMSEATDRAWWVILGVHANATEAEIRAAYKQRALYAGGATVDLNAAKEAGLRAAGA